MGLDASPNHRLVEKIDANGNKIWVQVPHFAGEEEGEEQEKRPPEPEPGPEKKGKREGFHPDGY
jgi:hypothetical protein